MGATTFTGKQTHIKMAKIRAMLAEESLTVQDISERLYCAPKWASLVVRYMASNSDNAKELYIAGWVPNLCDSFMRKVPTYRLMVTGSEWDRPKPKRKAKRAINKDQWKMLKSDPEKHDLRKAQRRAKSMTIKADPMVAMLFGMQKESRASQ